MIYLLFPASGIPQEDKDLEKSNPFVVKLENPSFSTVHATIDIGSIQRGKTTTIPLQFENLLDSGGELEATLTSNSNRAAKLELQCSKEEAAPWKKNTKNVEIVVECGGERFPINARCHFQW